MFASLKYLSVIARNIVIIFYICFKIRYNMKL